MNKIFIALLGAILLAGCTTIPDGPSRLALPGSGKSFDQFRVDENSCRQYALQQSGVSAKQAANDTMAKSAVVGTVVGTAIGAAIGGGEGAAFGAGSGLLVGTAAGSDTAAVSSYNAQERYDNAYIQCMYAQGHKVPVSGNFAPVNARVVPSNNTATPVQAAPSTPARVYYPPPPPPGYGK